MPLEAMVPSVPSSVIISVWSDYVCPFCYLELPVLDELQQKLGDLLTIDWRAFELRPDPVPTLDPDGQYLHRVWKSSVYPMAEERGMVLRLPPVQPRSRKALEAAEFARERNGFDLMNRALFRAFFEDGRNIADLSTLEDVACSVDLDGRELRSALLSDQYQSKVLADQALAQRLSISGVPAMLVRTSNGAQVLSGAQPLEAISAAIERLMISRGT